MTKHQLALKISRKIYPGKSLREKFDTYQSVQNYFRKLSSQDLTVIAGLYGIKLEVMN